jgi:phosphatidylinositol alpha-1,6-mannosyltransferase
MRILFITPTPGEASGYGRYAADVIAGAKASGHEVSVSVTRISIRDIGRGVRRARHADIVYAIDGWPFGVVAWLAAGVWRRKLIIGAIGTYTVVPLRGYWYSPLVRRAYATADAVIAISSYTQGRLLAAVPSAKCVRITPGVDSRKWHTDRVSGNAARVISVGGVKARKGHHTMLEAFALARKRIPRLTWVVVGGLGSRPYVEQLKMRATELGVSEAIEWAGEVSDVRLRELYTEGGLFVLLSENDDGRFEGFGIVFLEAAAAGLPVIGTLENGIGDAVGPDNGILVAQKDAATAARAIVALITDEERWQTMSKAGRAWAEGHDLASMHAAHEAVYARMSGRT